MNDLNNVNFDDIQLIADYIDGKLTEKERKDVLIKKLENDDEFIKSYIDSYEYLKNLEHVELKEAPDDLKKLAINKLKSRIIFRVLKNIVKLVNNSIENLKIKEIALEYLSEDNNKKISQKFALDNSIIEIFGSDDGLAKLHIDTEINTKINIINITDNIVIMDIKANEKSIELINIKSAVYKICINNDYLLFEIM